MCRAYANELAYAQHKSKAWRQQVFLQCMKNNSNTSTHIKNNTKVLKQKDINQRTFMDQSTGLMWQDEPYTMMEIGAFYKNNNQGKAGNWNYALSYCENLVYAGYSDWRLPDMDELKSIIDIRKDPSIKAGFKNATIKERYWASSPYLSEESEEWDLSFGNGRGFSQSKDASNFIRCVR
ncbi:hypothetical protein LDC_0941 [sediment metagenome]|uniref:Lcl C-terminal domain-containing protein n=1 Tax=sediment metagenome TaxID=749907 RepID=D9PHE1_9ZZZZ